MKYTQSIKLEMIKEMVTALCPQLDFVGFDAVEESRNFQVRFAEISKRVKIAAGIIYIFTLAMHTMLSFIPVWSTSSGMEGVPPSYNTVCCLIFAES